jgi:hypothetical protein
MTYAEKPAMAGLAAVFKRTKKRPAQKQHASRKTEK